MSINKRMEEVGYKLKKLKVVGESLANFGRKGGKKGRRISRSHHNICPLVRVCLTSAKDCKEKQEL